MPVDGLSHSMVAPIFFIGAMALLCLTPLAIPLLPVLLLYWYREKRAGRTVMFRWGLGNEPDPEPAGLTCSPLDKGQLDQPLRRLE